MRRLAMLLVLPLMAASGFGVYTYLGTLKSKAVRAPAKVPTKTKPKFVLPGTIYLAQGGSLFKLEAGTFTQVGSPGDWSQPALTPDHTGLVAVSRGALSSDIYLLDLNGHIVKQLTQDDRRVLELNHWAFYPRVTPDGSAVVYSYDSPKFGYQVDFSIWTLPLNRSQSQARRRTTGNDYTGGDVSPIPLSGTALLYVKHSIDPSGPHSQIWLQDRPGFFGKPLTDQADDCGEPALSPDGTQLAMICTGGNQSTRLEIAPFDGKALGPARVLVEGGLAAAPTWSPDGKALVYFAPAGIAGHFQLWWVSLTLAASATPAVSAHGTPTAGPVVSPAATPTAGPVVPVQVTDDVDLTATSPPAWY